MSAGYNTYSRPSGPATWSTVYAMDTGLLMGDGTYGGFRPLSVQDILGMGSGGSVQTSPGTPSATSAKSIVNLTSTLDRPAGTATYTVGYAVANSATAPTLNVLSGAALAPGRGGVLQNLILSKTGTNVTNATFRVHLYNYSGASTPAPDNQPITGMYSNSPYMIASIDFPTMTAAVGAGSIGRAQYQQAAILYSTTDTPHLYWYMEAQGAYAAASSEEFTLQAVVARD